MIMSGKPQWIITLLLLSVLAGVAEPQRAVAPLPPPPPGLPPPPPSPRELEIAAEVLSAFPQVSQQELMSFARVHLPDELERFAVAAVPNQGAAAGSVVRQEVEGERVLPDLDVGQISDVVDDDPHDLLARGVSQGVCNAAAAVSTFPPEREARSSRRSGDRAPELELVEEVRR